MIRAPRLTPLALLVPVALSAQQPDSARDTTITLTPVSIKAAAPERLVARATLSATKTNRLLRDVPQSVTVLTRSAMLDQAMQSMADVARFIPGVTMGLGEGHRDQPTIRGNSSTADFYVDGVRDDAQYLRDLYNVDRIEALKGSNAMMFGRGGGGGVINRVTKEAGWAPTRAVTVEGGSFAHKRTTLDLGTGVSPFVAVRLNGVVEASHQFRDLTTFERQGVNPTATIGSGATSLKLGYEHFRDRRTVNRGIPSFGDGPVPGDIATFFGDPDQSHARAAVDAADASFRSTLASGLQVRNHTRFVRYDKFYQNVFAGGAVNAAGTAVNLAAYNNATLRRNIFNQTDLAYSIASPGSAVKQTFLVGAEAGYQVSDNHRNTGFFNDSTTSLSVPLSDPTVAVPVTFRQSATDADNRARATVAAVYVQDEVSLGSHVQAIVGARYDRFDLKFHNHRTNEALRRVDTRISPRAGLVLKPSEPWSFYTTYSVSFLPSSGDQFSSLNVTTQTLEPEKFLNREVGLKWDVLPGVAIAAAAYQLDRSNTTAPDPADVTKVVQTGRQRTRGVEATIAGAITPQWQVVAGVTSQRAIIVNRTAAAAPGAFVPLVPPTTVSLWNRYDFLDWLGAGVGIVHQDAMFAAIDNTVKLPSFTRFDFAAFVRLGKDLRAQLNIENLFDTQYYATSQGNNNIMPGAPRTVRLSLVLD